MSITLLVGAFYGLLFAGMLWFAPRNRLANRFLALLLVVIAMRLGPYIIGYAGYYDAYPWLSFAPYDASLAIGPLMYFYVRLLPQADTPFAKRWLWHFVPVMLQLAYACVMFVQPLAFKNFWDGAVHEPYIFPVEQLATFVSMSVYWWLSFRHYRDYQRWLANNVSDREDHHAEWVRNFLLALGGTLIIWIGLAAFHRFLARLDYFQQFPFYVWLTVLAYYLGTEGYRNARHSYPACRNAAANESPGTPADEIVATAAANVAAMSEPAAPERNWVNEGTRCREQIIAAELYRDPDLTLTTLARKLGTNTSQLSRAINEGLGVNFNELINRLRVDRVKAALRDPAEARSLLDIAIDAGFSSKASFNRSFKLYAGLTPTEFREMQDVSRLKS